MKATVKQLLTDLEASLERIRTCVSWRALEQAERGSLAIGLTSRTRSDLRAEIGHFWKKSCDIEQMLEERSPARDEYLRRLRRLRARVLRIASSERFIYP